VKIFLSGELHRHRRITILKGPSRQRQQEHAEP
jgi:hypothetical protein